MHFAIATLFPGILDSCFAETAGLLGKAVAKNLLNISYLDLRAFGRGNYNQLDDAPYGGGAGLLLRPDVASEMVKAARQVEGGTRLVLMTPDGTPFSQTTARRLGSYPHVTLVCPRYEGLDERTRGWFDEEISVGDFVLSGGEYAAISVIDATARLLPGVLGNKASTHDESFSHPGRLEAAQYTRPEVYDEQSVPSVLTSGDHKNIQRYRLGSSISRTIERRLDLVAKYPLTREEQEALKWYASVATQT